MREYYVSMLAKSCCETDCSLEEVHQTCSSEPFQPSFDFPPADFIDFLNSQSPNDFPKPIQLPNYPPMKIK